MKILECKALHAKYFPPVLSLVLAKCVNRHARLGHESTAVQSGLPGQVQRGVAETPTRGRSTSLVTREKPIKTRGRYHFAPVRMSRIKNTNHTKC